uniref:uncharacterized zinc finger CCHC domain-containing protein At4g19190 n=1 Tax=Erigeron canadensis TaxID=72917 RepID=UPI001CB9162A|nr:uncharacterized zinc finger CCHC domain-containing protein At4g19190 [Erigeron canadensis]
MEDEERGGPRLSKRFSDKNAQGEVDYKTKAGTAWSHSYLNQKPWHPLSYPNQRRKWIAEQTHANQERRAEEVAREYAQEQEFFRQAALVSKKEKEKMENLKAVSFMYIRPPGYDPESAKAAEVAEEKRTQDPSLDPHSEETHTVQEPVPPNEQKKKPRPKDVFGRALPTEEEFEALKNAPKMETGVAGRARPFGIEIRNVKCVRCGAFGHQSGDRECPLKDTIMPNEESRLKRDDPLTAIIAQTESSEPLKWELKQQPGMSPPRGGFRPDDPNQQIVAEDIFDEYGGFLGEDVIPNLLANFSTSKQKKSSKRKHKGQSPSVIKGHQDNTSSDDDRKRSKKSKSRHKKRKKRVQSESSSSDDSEVDRHKRSRGSGHRRHGRSESSESDQKQRFEHRHHRHQHHHRHRRRSDYSD